MNLGIRRIIRPVVFVAAIATMAACGNNKSNSNTSNMPTSTSTDTFTHSTSADIPPINNAKTKKIAEPFIFRMMESANIDTTSVKNILRKK